VRLTFLSAAALLPVSALCQSIADFPHSSLSATEWRARNSSGSCSLTRQVAVENGFMSVTLGSPGPPQSEAQKQFANSYMVAVFSSLLYPDAPVQVTVGDIPVELQSTPGETLRSMRVAMIPLTSKLFQLVRAGTTLRVIFKDQTGAEVSVGFDSLGMNVAGPMFDACLAATSPNPRLERP